MKLNRMMFVAGVALAMSVGALQLLAQENPPPGGTGGDRQSRRGRGGPGGGNFDPSEFQKRMLERVKEQLEVTKDDEWKAIEPLVQKVFDVRREAMANGIGRAFGRGGRSGGDNNGGGDQNRRGGGFFGEPSAEAQALDKAIESKASKDELKAAMAKFRASKKDKEAKLKDAQDALRKVLSLRQEAIAVANGWLD